MLAVCKPGASAMTEREAVLDLCSRFWFGDEPSESGLEKGQTRATLAQLADAWGWERQRARRLIGRLVKAGEISTENLGRCTLITCAQTSHKVRTNSAQSPHATKRETRYKGQETKDLTLSLRSRVCPPLTRRADLTPGLLSSRLDMT